MTDTVALVAAKDRADTVAATVGALLALDGVDRVVVVDDGSRDATAAVAASAGARVLRLEENRGKGAAVAAGVDATPEAEVYLLVDADVGASAANAADLLGPVLAGEADMTVGVLPDAAGRGGFGGVRRLAGAGIARVTGFRPQAPLSGQRAVRGGLLRTLDLAGRFGLETALTIDVLRAGARVVEVPVEMEHRHTGRRVAGFVHRARQGADIVRALWPRVTTARTRVGLIAVGLLLAMVVALWSGTRWEPSSVPATAPADEVLVIGVPGLSWSEIGTGALPNLDRLRAAGALAAMSVRTGSHRPSLDEGYATLGSGSRVSVDPAATGVAAGPGPSLVVTDARQVRHDAGRHLPTHPGALGDALHAAGYRTAAVGDAALAVMDGGGVVDWGELSPASYADATRAAMGAADVTVVDTSGLGDHRQADGFIGEIVPTLAPTTLVVVVSVVPPGPVWRLTPVVMGGAGVVEGYLHSPATKRLGLVTLTDVAPTILARLGADVPDDLIGRPWRFHPGPVDTSRLARLDRDAAYRERIYFRIALGFVLTQALLYGAALAVLRRQGSPGWSRRALRTGALGCAAFPLATFLFRGIPGAAALGLAGVGLLVVVDLVLVALALRARRSALSPLAWVLGATTGVLVFDVVTGARLQTASIMGYSPHTAARFYGLGNTAFAALAAATILFAAIHVERAPRRREALFTVAAVLGLVLLVDGAPNLGDDVGGILTLTPVFAMALLLFAGRRITVRSVALAAGVTVAFLVLASTVELLRPPEARTHLGRVVSDTLRGDGTLFTTVARKAEVNLAVLRASIWTWTVPIIAGFGLVLLTTRRGAAGLLPAGSPRRAGVVVSLAAGLLGFALNDSGVIVTALVLVFVGPFLVFVALDDGPGGATWVVPEGPSGTPLQGTRVGVGVED